MNRKAAQQLRDQRYQNAYGLLDLADDYKQFRQNNLDNNSRLLTGQMPMNESIQYVLDETVPGPDFGQVFGGLLGMTKKAGKAIDLPMDEASRMARAKEMGFDTDTVWYHGTQGDIAAMDNSLLGETTGAPSALQAHFFAKKPSVASSYSSLGGGREYRQAVRNYTAAEKLGDWDEYNKWIAKAEEIDLNKTEQMQDLYKQQSWKQDELFDLTGSSLNADAKFSGRKRYDLLMDRFKRGELSSLTEDQIRQAFNHAKDIDDIQKQMNDVRILDVSGANVIPSRLNMQNPYIHDFGGSAYRDETYDNLIRKAKELGHDGVIFKNTFDPGSSGGEAITDIAAVFEPNQVRSIFAKFDPSKKDSANLLASGLLGAIGLGGLLGYQGDNVD